ncbi:MAG: DMT family transporter [Candidatus Nanopelagicales bacterium]
MVTKSHPLLASFALIIATALWGSSFAITQVVVTQMDLISGMFARSLIAVTILFLIRPKSVIRIKKSDFKNASVIGIFLGSGYLLQSWGLQYTTATASGFIAGMFVVFTPLVGALIFRDRIRGITWLAIVVAVFGLGIMTLRGVGFGFGESITLVTALMWSLQITFLSRWGRPEIAWAVTTIQMLVVAVMSLVLAAALGTLELPPSSLWDELVYLGAGAGALALLLQTWGQAQVSAVRAAIIFTLEPVWGAIFSVIIVADVITPPIAIGGALIISAMLISEYGAYQTRAAARAP